MKKYIILFIVVLVLLLSLQFFVKDASFVSPQTQTNTGQSYERIVSFLPSLTEILYALDVGDRVVGVTRYCKYPPEVKTKTKVGGILDTNYEVVYNLNPDLVVISKNNSDQYKMLTKMGIPVIEMETRNIPGILKSIRALGAKLGKEEKALAITQSIKETIERIKTKTQNLPKPKVLVTYDRTVGEGDIRQVYIAGNHTYFNDLLEIVGAENAYQGTEFITSPIVTPEGIFEMKPDIIVEIMNMLNMSHLTPDDVLKDWEALSGLKAYQNKRIYVFDQDYIDIPGPRIGLALDKLVRVIHPEIDWDE